MSLGRSVGDSARAGEPGDSSVAFFLGTIKGGKMAAGLFGRRLVRGTASVFCVKSSSVIKSAHHLQRTYTMNKKKIRLSANLFKRTRTILKNML